ncbi:MAG: glycosyltransferase family 2 protein, partial [Pseudomonadota bacterium]
MGKLPISVFLITRNEAARLPATLAALDWADEIVVVDSGSTDATCEIAEAAGARVSHRDWTGFGPQKVHAEGLCRNEWVLNLDADEVATPALAAELATLWSSPPAPAAFRLRILNVYPGDRAPRWLANDYNVVRLYHRSVAGYRDHAVYDRVEVAAGTQIRQLRAPVHHVTLTDWHQFVEKENRHSSFLAAEQSPKRFLHARLVWEMPVVFLKF